MVEETMRERIIRVLRESREPMTASELAAVLGLPPGSEREMYEHLRHVAKTIWRSSGGRLVLYMVPPRCRNCGYVFRDLDRPRKPSRCPRCGSQWIEPPRFYIAERG